MLLVSFVKRQAWPLCKLLLRTETKEKISLSNATHCHLMAPDADSFKGGLCKFTKDLDVCLQLLAVTTKHLILHQSVSE